MEGGAKASDGRAGGGRWGGTDVRHFLFHCFDQPCHRSLGSDSERSDKV